MIFPPWEWGDNGWYISPPAHAGHHIDMSAGSKYWSQRWSHSTTEKIYWKIFCNKWFWDWLCQLLFGHSEAHWPTPLLNLEIQNWILFSVNKYILSIILHFGAHLSNLLGLGPEKGFKLNFISRQQTTGKLNIYEMDFIDFIHILKKNLNFFVITVILIFILLQKFSS